MRRFPASLWLDQYRTYCRQLVCLALLFGLALNGLIAGPALATETQAGLPLSIGQRTIHVFRAPLGVFTSAERVESARKRIETAFDQNGAGWTSVQSSPQGVLVELDGKPMFYVLAGDALPGETPEALANQASRMLQLAWSEARERRAPGFNAQAALKAMFAGLALLLALTLIIKGGRGVQRRVNARLATHLKALAPGRLGSRLEQIFPLLVGRLTIVLAWLLGLLAVYAFLIYSLGLFALTRPASDNLAQTVSPLLMQSLHAVTGSLPGLFLSAIIFLMAWLATRISTEIFAHAATTPSGGGMLNAHTAPATRRIVNAALWIFAVAMAYPYLPGSHTEAFKGVSVILGIMVSIGASGLFGQIASGVMLVYTHALLVGEYVRIQDCEGTVTEIGLFVTRLRTGLGEEISLPNSLVLANVTHNYSRAAKGSGFILDTTITIGYDTPWRQVHALLLEAAATIPEVLKTPAPFVVQTALSDFYVAYKLVVYADAAQPATRARVTSDLHAAIQDAFNAHDVQIMSPHYFRDPELPKLVPRSKWYAAPAQHPAADA